jgi:hypothetical protein
MVAIKNQPVRWGRIIQLRRLDLCIGILGLLWLFWARSPALVKLVVDGQKVLETLPQRVHAAGLPVTNLQLEPRKVQVICDYLTAHGIREYFTDPSFLLEEHIQQRIVEGCWPIRCSPSAKDGFTREGFISAYSGDTLTFLSEEVVHVKRRD